MALTSIEEKAIAQIEPIPMDTLATVQKIADMSATAQTSQSPNIVIPQDENESVENDSGNIIPTAADTGEVTQNVLDLSIWRRARQQITDKRRKELRYEDWMARKFSNLKYQIARDKDRDVLHYMCDSAENVVGDITLTGANAGQIGTGSPYADNVDYVTAAEEAIFTAGVPEGDMLHSAFHPSSWSAIANTDAVERVDASGALQGLHQGRPTFMLKNTVPYRTQSFTGYSHTTSMAGTVRVNGSSHTAGATQIALDGLTTGAAVNDRFRIAGDSTWYRVNAAPAALASGGQTVSISPPLKSAPADNAVVTILGPGQEYTCDLVFAPRSTTHASRHLDGGDDEATTHIHMRDENTGMLYTIRKWKGDAVTHWTFSNLYGRVVTYPQYMAVIVRVA